MTDSLPYPAEHRALRELLATCRQLSAHWSALARHGDAPQEMTDGAEVARELAAALEPIAEARGVPLRAAAYGTGAWLAGLRRGGDVLLERNQALRAAVLDGEHVAILLAYLGALAARREDAELADFHARWEARVREVTDAARSAAVACAQDPDVAIEPAVPSAAGRAGQRFAAAMGSVGEAIDASPVGRAVSRR